MTKVTTLNIVQSSFPLRGQELRTVFHLGAHEANCSVTCIPTRTAGQSEAANQRRPPLIGWSSRSQSSPENPTCAPCSRRPRRTLGVGTCAHQIPPLDVSRQHSRSGKAARPFPAARPELPRPLPRSRESSPGSDPTRTRSPR